MQAVEGDQEYGFAIVMPRVDSGNIVLKNLALDLLYKALFSETR